DSCRRQISRARNKMPGRVPGHFSFALLRGVAASADQWPQRRIMFDNPPPLDEAIEAKYMTGTFDHQIDDHASIHDMIVDQVIVDVLDIREVHMRRPIHDQQHDREWRAYAYQQTEDQRQSDQ